MDSIWELSNAECERLKTPSYLELVVSMYGYPEHLTRGMFRYTDGNSFILIGLLISYLPQHYRIISRGTSEGISPYFVLLGTTSATAGFANILTVPPSRAAIGCCKELETFECAAGLLGVAQLGMQWLCFALMYVKRDPAAQHATNKPEASSCSSYFFGIERPMCPRRSWAASPPNGRRLPWSASCAWFTA